MRDITLLDDTVLYLHNEGEMLSDRIAHDKDYFEHEILQYLSGNYPQHDIILDIGANIGNHTVYFAQYLEYSSIIAFEPIFENYKLLRKNTAPFVNIICRNEAVGETRKIVRMEPNRGNMGASEIRDNGSVTAQQIRIDDLFLINKVTLMKIDVEWSELNVLKGAKAIIEEDKPLILIEDVERAYFTTLTDLGYDLRVSWPDHKTYLYGPKNAET